MEPIRSYASQEIEQETNPIEPQKEPKIKKRKVWVPGLLLLTPILLSYLVSLSYRCYTFYI